MNKTFQTNAELSPQEALANVECTCPIERGEHLRLCAKRLMREVVLRLEQSEAQSAAMRDALTALQAYIGEHRNDPQSVADLINGAISGDSGQALLDRLKNAEADRDKYRKGLEALSNWPHCDTKVEGGTLCNCPLQDFGEGVELRCPVCSMRDRLKNAEAERDKYQERCVKLDWELLELQKECAKYLGALESTAPWLRVVYEWCVTDCPSDLDGDTAKQRMDRVEEVLRPKP